MLLSPPTFTTTHLPYAEPTAPPTKRRCINPVLSASRALHAITSTTPADTLPSLMVFGAPLQMPLSPPMEGTASLPRRRALRRKQVDDDRDGKRRKIASKPKAATQEEKTEKSTEEEKKKPRGLFVTPEQRSLPAEVPRGLSRTVFAQAFEPSRPRGFSDQDDQELMNLVAESLSSYEPSTQPPQTDNYTVASSKACPSTPPSNTRKRRRED